MRVKNAQKARISAKVGISVTQASALNRFNLENHAMIATVHAPQRAVGCKMTMPIPKRFVVGKPAKKMLIRTNAKASHETHGVQTTSSATGAAIARATGARDAPPPVLRER